MPTTITAGTPFSIGIQKKLKSPNLQTFASQGVSKDEHKQKAVTAAHAPDLVKCAVTNFVAGNVAHH